MTSRTTDSPYFWRAIDTAPRDGTVILCADVDGDLPLIGMYEPELGGGFRNAQFGDEFWPQPTHWMPLPEPPNKESNGSSKNLSTEGMVE